MRIWSLHPKYLDSKGLVALWRETLLAKHVLEGKTKGYLNHPQLQRFKKAKRPIECINQYLYAVYEESVERNYNFDKNKFNQEFTPSELPVTNEQIIYEKNHLLKKLKSRDRDKYYFFKKWALMLYLDIQNILNFKNKGQNYIIREKNPDGSYKTIDDGKEYVLKSVPNDSGTILPTVGIMVKF